MNHARQTNHPRPGHHHRQTRRQHRIELHRLEHEKKFPLADTTTNPDGRLNSPLLANETLTPGKYRLLFHVGDYFTAQKNPDAKKFLDVVPILFHITDPNRKLPHPPPGLPLVLLHLPRQLKSAPGLPL